MRSLNAHPEEQARERIDEMLVSAGWIVQDYKQAHIHAGRGVVLRNFPLMSGHGFADYLLYVDGKAAGVIEAKKEGVTLTGVEIQAEKYSKGLPHGSPGPYTTLAVSLSKHGSGNAIYQWPRSATSQPACIQFPSTRNAGLLGCRTAPRSQPIFTAHQSPPNPHRPF